MIIKPVPKKQFANMNSGTGITYILHQNHIAVANMIPVIYRDDNENIGSLETITVTRSEQIHIGYDDIISYQAHAAKNLWNQALYETRQIFFWNQQPENRNKKNRKKMLTYGKLDKMFHGTSNYTKMYSSTAQWVLKKLKDSWNSYFKGIARYRTNPEEFTGEPRIPGYKEKDGEFMMIFTNQACCIGKNGRDDRSLVQFPPKSKIKSVMTRLDSNVDLREVRIVPKGGGYKVEVVYNKKVSKEEIAKLELDSENIAGIDLGVNNTVAIGNNIAIEPIVVKGGILKAENQWYNKRRSELYSVYDRQKIGCFLKRDKKGNIKHLIEKNGRSVQLTTKNRNRKVKDIMHKISRFVVNYCILHKIGTIVIGINPFWKQKTNIGRRNNQNFVNIPFDRLIEQITYKASEVGITVIEHEEAHTSKCSFMDNEEICHHDEYLGTRIKRGLFKTAQGILINADVQGAMNIIKKVFPNAFVKTNADGIAGTLTCPLRLSIKDLLNKKVSI